MTQVRFGLNKAARLQAERADDPDKKLPVELEPRFPYACLPAPIKTDFNSSTIGSGSSGGSSPSSSGSSGQAGSGSIGGGGSFGGGGASGTW